MAREPARRPRAAFPEPALARVAQAMRRHERFDLDGYRRAYVLRRLAVRLTTLDVPADAYAARVEEDAGERRALVDAIGVNVTAFFRDPAVWLFLEEVALPPLVDEKRAAGERVRVLSLGCAGGQEAYSAAMLLAELLDGDLGGFAVEAVDVDGAALDVAREAWYPAAALEHLSAAARARYFEPEGAGYRVTDALRRRVRVEKRDMLTQDLEGPFDVVLLRNVAIYFDKDAKDRLLKRVHAALAPRGLLVLGQAETTMGQADAALRPLSLRNRVYAKVS